MKQVWFAPDFAVAVTPFLAPDQWSLARSKINVFKFYTQTLMATPPRDPTTPTWLNELIAADAFALLTQWGIEIAIEAQVGCNTVADGRVARALQAIETVHANGGRVTYIALDSSLGIGVNDCSQRMAQAAAQVQIFVSNIQAAYPSVSIGIIEQCAGGGFDTWPVTTLTTWIDLLISKGFRPAFLHIDSDPAGMSPADATTLETASTARRMAFGIVYKTSNVSNTLNTDDDFYTAVMLQVTRLKAGMANPEHLVFQSWALRQSTGVRDIPTPLPESAAATHTRLINDGLAVLAPPVGTSSQVGGSRPMSGCPTL